jgi:hypothetical protein
MHLSRFTILAAGTHRQLNPRDRVFQPPFRNSDLREGESVRVRISRFEILAAGIGSLNPHLRIPLTRAVVNSCFCSVNDSISSHSAQ